MKILDISLWNLELDFIVNKFMMILANIYYQDCILLNKFKSYFENEFMVKRGDHVHDVIFM